jgi:hypothetical protein
VGQYLGRNTVDAHLPCDGGGGLFAVAGNHRHLDVHLTIFSIRPAQAAQVMPRISSTRFSI